MMRPQEKDPPHPSKPQRLKKKGKEKLGAIPTLLNEGRTMAFSRSNGMTFYHKKKKIIFFYCIYLSPRPLKTNCHSCRDWGQPLQCMMFVARQTCNIIIFFYNVNSIQFLARTGPRKKFTLIEVFLITWYFKKIVNFWWDSPASENADMKRNNLLKGHDIFFLKSRMRKRSFENWLRVMGRMCILSILIIIALIATTIIMCRIFFNGRNGL